MLKIMVRYCPFLILIIALFSCETVNDPLKTGFLNPPDSARPGVYWYFMDGNLDRDEMTADLESMKEAGIGYVLFLEVNVGVPRGEVDFLSEEWQDLFVHGVRECERLGIKLVLGSGPGWAGSGGPWVKPEQSMMHLVASKTEVTGPGIKKIVLPVPEPRTPIFGDRSLPGYLHDIRNEWYEDVVVLAYPTPAKDYTLPDIDEKALVYRHPYTSVEGVKPFLPSLARYPDIKNAEYSKEDIIDLTDKLQPDGTLSWEIPPGKWTILRMGKRNNGGVTRPAPRPGLGLECDKFDPEAMDAHYAGYLGKLLDKTGPRDDSNGGGWTMIHIDSWEMGAQNWTHDFREQFNKRRGYDPLPYLPAYTGQLVENMEITERFLWDVRLTGMELILENHAGRFKELGRESGKTLSIEPYDMNPAADLDLGAVADIPMCEFWTNGFGFNSAFSCLESTSIGHVLGKKVIAAEAFTAKPQEAWKMYPGNMKNQSDWAFAMGINRFFYHTFVHKACGEDKRPGMTMGPYGVHWDRGQTWWPMVRDYHDYVSRCQFVLSQGTPVSDILYLTLEGAPNVFTPPASALAGTDTMPDKKQWGFDGCSPLMLIDHAEVVNEKIVFEGGGSYEILVLPKSETMTPELLEKLNELLEGGAIILGNKPVKSPSLSNYPECDEKVKSLADKLWNSSSDGKFIHEAWYDEGELYPDYESTGRLLKQAGVCPDFAGSDSLRYHHQSHPDREVYFISNKTGNKVEESCIFRDGSPFAEYWDPLTKEIVRKESEFLGRQGFKLNINLEPYGSCFIVFYQSYRNLIKNPHKNSSYSNITEIKGPWEVSFDPEWGGPGKINFDELTDWKDHSDEGIRYYSGKAEYKTTFDLPEDISPNKFNKIGINIGEVSNLAKVYLNGKDLGVLWTFPWEVDVKDVIEKEDNILEIHVVNLWINRLIGDQFLPDSSRYTFTTHNYYTKDDPLVSSGLLGPVRIMVYK